MSQTKLTTAPQSNGLFSRLRFSLRCLLGTHEPDRNKVRRDRVFYTGKCRHCGVPIRKRNGQPWKAYKPED